jgi:hypothetical protein
MKITAIKVAVSLFLLLQISSVLHANVVLWTKTIPAATTGINGNYLVRVGQDGSVVVVDGYSNTTSAKWYNRKGVLIKAFNINPFSGNAVKYVSQHEILISGSGVTDIYQLNASNQLINTRLSTSVSGPHVSEVFFTYPYLLEWKDLEGGGHELTLRDLTLPEVYTVLGGAVIGIHGSNLQVRWKTVANTKYKVQKSTDINTWTDYTEIIDGNGATMVVNIPVDGNSGSVYARVIKL